MIKTLALIGMISTIPFNPAAAQESVFWKSVGDWDISIDTTIQDGCYALASWSGGTEVRIGRNPELENFYVLIGNEKWASLTHGGEYDIKIKFGGRPVWDVTARGWQFGEGGTVFLHAQSTKMDFVREFQRALTMKISYDGKEIDTLKLTGSRKAWDAVEACQKEVAARGSANIDDPFASSGGNKKSTGNGRKTVDPFAD